MNESTKTGVFWAVAVVMLAIATFVAWPASRDGDGMPIAGRPLFKEFKDPLTAASLKIVTFDETLGQLENFEVRKDRETGVWTIPSRQHYPADAVEQMTNAANALVGLTILDIQTANAEDHDDLGVVEPKLEDLEVGDSGVGRLVTFKDESQDTIASLIIGKPVEGEEGKIYVRKPGQDPVYVVKLDDAAMTTNFQKWIEEDLLKLSSIDISGMEIKDYSTTAGLRGVSLNRNYNAEVEFEDNEWKIEKLVEFDPNDPRDSGTEVEIGDRELNAEKLNEMKNALDDLKIVDVLRKPEGMSANLRADQDLVSDDEAVMSLAQRGFYPVSLGPGNDREVLSANGELVVTLNDGVEYILRFGNVAGLTETDQDESDEEESESVAEGVNRYMLVTTEVDESQFPAPDLQEVPESLEDLEQLLKQRGSASGAGGQTAEADAGQPQMTGPETEAGDNRSTEPEATEAAPAGEEEASTDKATPSEEESSDSPGAQSETKTEGGNESSAESTAAGSEGEGAEAVIEVETSDSEAGGDDGETSANDSADENADSESATEGEVEVSGSGEASGSGGGQDPAASDDQQETDAVDEVTEDEAANSEQEPAATESDESDGNQPEADKSEDNQQSNPADSEDAEAAGEKADVASVKPEADDNVPEELKGLTREEKLELLEAEQEKIVKANQRKLDERQEQIDEANREVRELNARFADWYYVIPEDTYQKLRIDKQELFASSESSEDEAATTPNFGEGVVPNFNIPAPAGN